MKAIVLGFILIAAAVIAVLPQGLNWWPQLVMFLRGGLPILAALIGLLALLIGIADIKDGIEAKKEEKETEHT